MPNGFESIMGEVIPDVDLPSPAVGMALPDWGPGVWETMSSAIQPLGGLTLNAWSPAAAADQATPTGWLDWLNRVAAQVERPVRLGVTLLGGLTSGAMALQSARQQRMQERAQRAGLEMMRQQQAVAGPPQAAAAQLVPAGAAALAGGALPPGLEAQLDLWERQMLAEEEDRMARLGLTDSSARAQLRAEIRARKEALRAQLAQALMQGGLAAAQTAAAALGGAAGTARGLETAITGQLASTDELIRRAQAELSSYLGQA